MITNNFDFVDIFENKLAQYTGFKYAVCTDCCTNAILIALEMLRYLKKISKYDIIDVTKYTYMSIPMTLKNNGWHIQLTDDKWIKKYQLGVSKVFDAATDFHENMHTEYDNNSIVCISFQQKKRLSLGRGGCILTDDKKYFTLLKRLIYDGRDRHLSDKDEISYNSKDILCGYHCYMEPDKAAKGILLLNQKEYLPEYKIHSWKNYIPLDNIQDLFI